MGDLRIQKTKEKLRVALGILLQEMSFEQISVTALCKQSGVSRITFYAYYDDKFALVNELFEELLEQVRGMFLQKQAGHNPEGNPKKSCRNLLGAVLEMQRENRAFLEEMALENNAYLSFAYDFYILQKAEAACLTYVEQMQPALPARMTANLLCTGLWRFLRTGILEGEAIEIVCIQAEQMLELLLESGIFQAKRRKGKRSPSV